MQKLRHVLIIVKAKVPEMFTDWIQIRTAMSAKANAIGLFSINFITSV
jgi:hypothetical protein